MERSPQRVARHFGGANVTVKNLTYNGTIAAGATYTGVGFNGS